jgi:hypothetical protein
MRRLRAILLAAVLLGVALPGTARGAFPGEDGRIAAIDPNGSRIRIMDPDGGNVVLGPTAGAALWSPGGTMLTFLAGSTVYAVDPDGSHQRAVIALPHSIVYDFTWAPDGSQLAYTAWDPAGIGQKELYVISIDGGPARRLTHRPQNDSEPSWSPDGQWIAYTREVYHYGVPFHVTHEIWAIRTDRSEVRQLSVGPNDAAPDWASDGSRIAFSRSAVGATGIQAVNPDGTGLAQLVAGGWPGHAPPSYSPAGGHLVYSPPIPGGEVTVVTSSGDPVATIGVGRRPDWQPLPAFPLVDARFSPFEEDIVWAFGEGVTLGCSSERYCPIRDVTRGQLAAFIGRVLELPPTEEDFFFDDDTSPFEDDINRLAAAGIVSGCGPDRYCPTAAVTREQAATFLANALELPGPATDHFTDDEASVHEGDINRLADAGIAHGCGATTYCPTRHVSRGEMAALLHRAFGPD